MRFLTTDYSSTATVGLYRIDADRRLRIEEYKGKTVLADLRSIITTMPTDPCWSPAYHGLIDFSDADLDLTANDVLRLALLLRHEEHRSTGWLAFVAPTTSTYGIVRMLGYWSRATDRLRIFQTRDEAEAWLERNVDRTPPCFAVEQPAPRPAEQPAAATGLRSAI